MNAQASMTTTESSNRFAGWTAITSGVIGIVAFGFLVAAVAGRASGGDAHQWEIRIRTHDAGLILQCLFMIPVALALHRFGPGSISRMNAAVGVTALSAIVLCVFPIFFNTLSDTLYMVPQGVLGIWLIVLNLKISNVLPRGVRWLGMFAGVGLFLVSIFPIAYVIFVDATHLFRPVPFDYNPPQARRANAIVHMVLLIGTFMGVATYPIWSIFLGRKLLRTS
jgi:hypothetical protein